MLLIFMINLRLLLGILMRFLWKGINLGEEALALIGPFSSKSALTIDLWLIWDLLGLVSLGPIEGIFVISFKKELTDSLQILAGMHYTLMLELPTSLDVCLIIARCFLRRILPIVCFCLDPLNSKFFGCRMYLFWELSRRLGAGLDLSGNLLKIFLEEPRFGTRIILVIFLGRRKGSWLVLTTSKKPSLFTLRILYLSWRKFCTKILIPSWTKGGVMGVEISY